MKFLCCSEQKLTELILIFIFLISLSGCQKELVETEMIPDNENLGLKAAKITNLMVITKSDVLPEGFETKLAAFGEIVSSTPEIGTVVIKPKDSNSKKQVEALTEVRAVVPDLIVRWVDPGRFTEEATTVNPFNDPNFKFQWGLDAINAPEAWNAGFSGEGASVFILDSGISKDHPDLSPNINTSLCTSFVPGQNYFQTNFSLFNHGSHVAGIIAAADNTRGIVGVAPHAEIVAVKVLSETTGSGAFSWINAGIVYAANNGADVINMSLGTSFNRNGFYMDENGVWQKEPAASIQNLIIAQQRAINYAVKNGATVVVSAGNSGLNADGNAAYYFLMGNLHNVIAVSATAPYNWAYDYINGIQPNLDLPASYTNYGKSLVDIAAPGGDFDFTGANRQYDFILSTSGTSYYFASGTSMAAPHVSGVAALIIGKNGGDMDPIAVTQQILKTADPVAGNGSTAYFGKGRVNAFRAVTE